MVQEVVLVSERLAWLVLRAVNRAQAKGSTVRLVAPRDPKIVHELDRELGLAPTDEELISAEEYLLEYNYLAPTSLGITMDIYTLTLAGLDWLERDLEAPRGTSQQGASEEAQRRETRQHGAPEPLGERPKRAEEAGSIVVLRGERDRLLQELEELRLRIERLEAELGRRSPWYERLFG